MSIITPQQYAASRSDISVGWSKETAKIQRCINEAEDVDLYDVLGSFYFDVIENSDTTEYVDLMNGSEFTYEGERQKHIGLINYIAGLTYSRHLPLMNSVSTTHGRVVKLNQNSEPVNYAAIKAERKDVDITLEVQFKRIENYIKSKPQTFSTYGGVNNPSIKTNSIKTTTLR